MLVAELIRSCSHAKVAEAAIHSIGPDLVREVGLRARERGLDAGAYVAQSVRVFAGACVRARACERAGLHLCVCVPECVLERLCERMGGSWRG
jgi:hypothetical protein